MCKKLAFGNYSEPVKTTLKTHSHVKSQQHSGIKLTRDTTEKCKTSSGPNSDGQTDEHTDTPRDEKRLSEKIWMRPCKQRNMC